MKKSLSKILVILFIFALSISVFTACETINEYDYMSDKYISYYEPNASSAVYSGNAFYLQTENAEYYFASSISLKDRNRYVTYSELILEIIDYENAKIYVLSSYSSRIDEDGALYTEKSCVKSVSQIILLLCTKNGAYSNYGAVYGLANYYAKELKWNYEKENSSVGLTAQSIDTYDINLLCFSEKFVGSRDVKVAKNIALQFNKYYLENHTPAEMQALIKKSSDKTTVNEFNEILNSFYVSKNITPAFSEVLYTFGGNKYEYILHHELGTTYLSKDWVEAYYPKAVSQNFLHENYPELKLFFETLREEMYAFQAFFSFSNYNNNLDIFFINIERSHYLYSHVIEVNSVRAYAHEYIHSLTYGRRNNSVYWSNEAIATYYSTYYDTYGCMVQNYDYRTESYPLMDAYVANTGREIDWEIDAHTLIDIIACRENYTHPSDDVYYAGASFINYLVSVYGDEAVRSALLSENGRFTSFDKSYNALAIEWRAYLDSTYSGYKRT